VGDPGTVQGRDLVPGVGQQRPVDPFGGQALEAGAGTRCSTSRPAPLSNERTQVTAGARTPAAAASSAIDASCSTCPAGGLGQGGQVRGVRASRRQARQSRSASGRSRGTTLTNRSGRSRLVA